MTEHPGVHSIAVADGAAELERARGRRHTGAVSRSLHGSALYRRIARVLSRHLDPAIHRAWIIGSEAAGTAGPGADVDVAIRGSARIDLAVLARIRTDLERLPTLRSFDLVDLSRASDRFERESLATSIALPLGEDAADHVEG